jgi:hypothetical protein
MTPTRLREIREIMHLPVRSLARWVGRSESSLRQMEADQRAIPAALGEWVEALGRWQERHPPPEKTR